MTSSDLDEIEQALQLSLPQSYRRLMLNYPPQLMEASFTIEHESGSYTERASEMEFVNSAEAVIALNKSDPANYHYSCRPSTWPATHLIIGQNDFGDVYGIDATVENSAVYMGGPHCGEYDESGCAPSLEAFAAHLIRSYEGRRSGA